MKSLFKAIKLLDYFTNDAPERGISELSELSGLLKSTVHNIVTTFEQAGFLEKNPETNKYHLGMKVLQLSNNLYATHDLRRIIRPYLEEFCDASRETVYLAKLSEDEVIYIDAIYPIGVTPGRSVIGLKAPLYCTGVGKAILANLPENELQKIIAKGLEPFTPYTITDPVAFLQEMNLIRARGYAIDNMEHEYGIKCIAVPIQNYKGTTVASVSISGPSLRFTEPKIEEYAAMLLRATREMRGLIQR
ncbi:IclR family transcriptional regulator [Hydrogenispora ethanolica]|uniref:IclR family transcriptional regulator n=1 Tax=Hydrogenispora ethanolica TaxID=1082276 RepID=A0A4R1REC4_HYDET|nr:IclR family transcriptional regulator [Hydrogenispora ethanolica]TCL64255.1 IclR family transcriptional regulator [Hydrogenispora ethanolica]